MSPRDKVEQRCFSAIGITHEGNVNGASLFHGHVMQPLFSHLIVLAFFFASSLQGCFVTTIHGFGLFSLQGLGLFGRYDFDHIGLFVSERHFIAHNLIFYRVLQWGIEQHLHHLSLDESHFNDTFSESTMSEHLYDNSLFPCA